jgi:uncharacterized membrane protein
MLKKTINKAKDLVKVKPRTAAELERDARQLKRLERLIDVIYAILIWAVFQNLPVPSAEEFEKHSDMHILNEYKNSFIAIFIGIFMIITYWSQNNRVFGNLKRTDGRHASLSLIQLCFLLLYLYSIGFEMVFTGNSIALIAQSVTLSIAGFMSVFAWSYAMKNRRLISDAIPDKEAEELKIGIFAEPLAAAFTIPFAFIGPGAWNLSWLSLLFFSWLLKKRHAKKHFRENNSDEKL